MDYIRASIKFQENGGITFVSADDLKRYYFTRRLDEHLGKKLTLLMYNPSTLSGKDKTVIYIEKVCRHHGFGSYEIINLIPLKGGNPELIDWYFDDINLKIISRVLSLDTNPIWVGWGRLIKGKTQTLFPSKLKNLLKQHADRLVHIQNMPGKQNRKYPLHPSWLSKNCTIEETMFVPFNAKHLDSY